uniref:tRNA(Ile)-lysidine synthase n=1 Tax=Mastocarpus papillatus TaxID=31436 RepID=A0A342RZS2_9FLOR|nr:tRNA(Ile)-lysidine synthase [Mastocarpus papillatus]AOL58218.1 tRNA(Ile)-lysidine synthase [Mastocarpus papillatus]
MYTYLHESFYTNMRNIIDSQPLSSILIALSGGQDSLCLVRLLQDFIKEYKCRLNISYIHIDHQWKKDSQKQVEHLINLLKIKNEKIYIYQIQHIVKSELEARNIRYQILIQHAANYKYTTIITGHTSTDKIETFLQQLMRGTTIDGATSLTHKRQLNKDTQIIRPLINYTRSDLAWFCRKFTLPVWSDISNYEYNINRNRLRNELLPYLNQYFLFNVEQQINYFLHISDIENEYIKQNAIKLYMISRHETNLALNYLLINKQHHALQARTLQIFIYHNFSQSLSQSFLNKIIYTIQKTSIKHYIIEWKNLRLKKYDNWLYIY